MVESEGDHRVNRDCHSVDETGAFCGEEEGVKGNEIELSTEDPGSQHLCGDDPNDGTVLLYWQVVIND